MICHIPRGVIRLPIQRGIKEYKCMVILRDSPYNSPLFGLVSYSDPWSNWTPFRNAIDSDLAFLLW